MIKSETGLDVAIDQTEITDIILGKKLSPTTFDFEMLHETWNAFDRAAPRRRGKPVANRARPRPRSNAWLKKPRLGLRAMGRVE